MEKSSIVYSFLVRAHNLQILRIEQGSTPRINRSILATLLFDAIANIKRITLSFSRFAPHHGRLFRPLNPIVISVTVIRRHDVALPSISTTVFTTPKPHGLTIVELRVAYTRYPTGSTDRYSLAAVIKWNRLTGTADTEAHIPSKLGSITVLDLLPPTSIPPEQTVLRLHFRHQEEAQSIPKVEINPSCHP
jgi:hypothetical protein